MEISHFILSDQAHRLERCLWHVCSPSLEMWSRRDGGRTCSVRRQKATEHTQRTLPSYGTNRNGEGWPADTNVCEGQNERETEVARGL